MTAADKVLREWARALQFRIDGAFSAAATCCLPDPEALPAALPMAAPPQSWGFASEVLAVGFLKTYCGPRNLVRDFKRAEACDGIRRHWRAVPQFAPGSYGPPLIHYAMEYARRLPREDMWRGFLSVIDHAIWLSVSPGHDAAELHDRIALLSDADLKRAALEAVRGRRTLRVFKTAVPSRSVGEAVPGSMDRRVSDGAER